MSGAKGRSGGPRPNAGGARPGAGRKPKAEPPPLDVKPTDDALQFLLGVMQDVAAAPALRVRSAIAAAQYQHVKKGEGGKKDAAKTAAAAVTEGGFKPGRAPLRVVNGR